MLTSEPTPSDASHRLSRSFLTSQMKELGDPMRRGADHGEAFGASIKDDLHNRTLRRLLAVQADIGARVAVAVLRVLLLDAQANTLVEVFSKASLATT